MSISRGGHCVYPLHYQIMSSSRVVLGRDLGPDVEEE